MAVTRRVGRAAGRSTPVVRPVIRKRYVAHTARACAASIHGRLIRAFTQISSVLVSDGLLELRSGSTVVNECADALDRVFTALERRLFKIGVTLLNILSPKKKRRQVVRSTLSMHDSDLNPEVRNLAPEFSGLNWNLEARNFAPETERSASTADIRYLAPECVKKLRHVPSWAELRRKFVHNRPGFARDLWHALGTIPNGLTIVRRANWPPIRFRRATLEWKRHAAAVAAYCADHPRIPEFESGYDRIKLPPASFESLELPHERAARLRTESEPVKVKTTLKNKQPLKSILRPPPPGWKPLINPLTLGPVKRTRRTHESAVDSISSPINVQNSAISPTKTKEASSKRISFASEDHPNKPLVSIRQVSSRGRSPRSRCKRKAR